MKINVKTVLNPKQSDKVLKAKLLKNLQVQIREWNDGAGREKGHENHEKIQLQNGLKGLHR